MMSNLFSHLISTVRFLLPDPKPDVQPVRRSYAQVVADGAPQDSPVSQPETNWTGMTQFLSLLPDEETLAPQSHLHGSLLIVTRASAFGNSPVVVSFSSRQNDRDLATSESAVDPDFEISFDDDGNDGFILVKSKGSTKLYDLLVKKRVEKCFADVCTSAIAMKQEMALEEFTKKQNDRPCPRTTKEPKEPAPKKHTPKRPNTKTNQARTLTFTAEDGTTRPIESFSKTKFESEVDAQIGSLRENYTNAHPATKTKTKTKTTLDHSVSESYQTDLMNFTPDRPPKTSPEIIGKIDVADDYCKKLDELIYIRGNHPDLSRNSSKTVGKCVHYNDICH
jgi:hypothetical protein